MSVHRNLRDVLDSIIEVVPSSETHTLAVLRDLQSSVSFSAPELITFWWNEVADALNDNLGFPDSPWKLQIDEIFSGRSAITSNLED